MRLAPCVQDVTAAIRIAAAVVMLLVASVSDLRTRRVPNHTWSPFVVAAAVFTLHDVASGVGWRALLAAYGVAVCLAGLWYVLWWLGAFGGADAKALMVLVWLLPWPLHGGLVPPALDAVVNGALLVVVLPLLLLAVNAVRGDLRLPAALLGVQTPLEEAQAMQVWPMQRVVDGQVRFQYWQRVGQDMDGVYRDLAQAGLRRVWTTPKIPFMVPLLIGLVWAAWQGNILLRSLHMG